MPSLIPGYEYDIFISYRQKDNKGDHWVTEFVNALKTELEATFKEDISIYFDENPHDGLLETHNVDKSLESKLKCLIFIPIISQTYCDPKSFAWQQEFCVFNKLAKEDQFGRDIRLNNGNVASRILPVKIHDLDAEDKTLLENELGSVLRSIEFIYKSAGVNRPIKPKDDELHDNSYRTVYRNQVNKVANAVKETIYCVKNPSKVTLSKTTLDSYSTDESPKKSVAVLPFVNMSNDPGQEYFSDGISEEILNLLASIPGLLVPARTSSFHFKGRNEEIQEIGKALNVEYILEGSFRKSGNRIRIGAQLVQVSTGYHVWSERFDKILEDIFAIQDEIAQSIVNVLKIKLDFDGRIPSFQKGQSLEAHNHFLQAMFFSNKGDPALIRTSIYHYNKATEVNSKYVDAFTGLANTLIKLAFYGMEPFSNLFSMAGKAAEQAVYISPSDANGKLALARIAFVHKWDFQLAAKLFREALSLNPNNTETHLWYGDYLNCMGRFEEARTILQKATQLDPFSIWAHLFLSHSYFNLGNSRGYQLQTEKIHSLEPDFMPLSYDLAYTYAAQNRLEESLKIFLSTMKTKWPLIYGEAINLLAKEGKSKMLEYILTTFNNIRDSAFVAAMESFFVFVLKRDFEKAVDNLYESYNEKSIWVPYYKTHVIFKFKEIQDNPRFQKLIASLNFPAI